MELAGQKPEALALHWEVVATAPPQTAGRAAELARSRVRRLSQGQCTPPRGHQGCRFAVRIGTLFVQGRGRASAAHHLVAYERRITRQLRQRPRRSGAQTYCGYPILMRV